MPEETGNAAEITLLLQEAGRGSTDARERLSRVVYAQLKKLAGNVLYTRRRPGDSIESRQLVNDVLIRLLGNNSIEWTCSAQFYGIAAREMRRIWIDYIRSKNATKRGGPKISLDGLQVGDSGGISVDMLALDEVLDRIEKESPRQVKVFELLFFAGLTNEEAGRALGVAEVTVRRDYQLVRLKIMEALSTPRGAKHQGHGG